MDDGLPHRAPDVAEPILACRIWNVDPGSLRLRSLRFLTAWPVGQPVRALCGWAAQGPGGDVGHGPIPSPDCSCGIWGLGNPGDLGGQGPLFVRGAVQLWGRVLAGTRGWRAEYAYPAALIAELPTRPWPYVEAPLELELIKAVADRYRVPLLGSWPVLSKPGALRAA